MGAGIFAIGAGTPRETLAAPLLEKNSKDIGYDERGRDVEYKAYKVRFDEEEFLDNAKYIDSAWGNKYREKIDGDYWKKETKGIFDGNLAYALGIKESSMNPKVENSINARGLYQIMPYTWKGLTSLHFDNAFNPVLNQQMAAKNLGDAINYLEKNLEGWEELSREDKQKLVLASHNWGQGNVVKVKGNLYNAPLETRDLIQKVMTVYGYFNEEDRHADYLVERGKMEKMNYLESKEVSFVVPNS